MDVVCSLAMLLLILAAGFALFHLIAGMVAILSLLLFPPAPRRIATLVERMRKEQRENRSRDASIRAHYLSQVMKVDASKIG